MIQSKENSRDGCLVHWSLGELALLVCRLKPAGPSHQVNKYCFTLVIENVVSSHILPRSTAKPAPTARPPMTVPRTYSRNAFMRPWLSSMLSTGPFVRH